MENKFNRQPEDYILTDLLPVEKGNYFTHIYFYEYIVKKEIIYNQSISPEDIINPRSHSIPLKFKTKNGESFREISIVNPYGLIEAIYFIKFYGDEVINILNYRNNFGQRIPKKNKNALYKGNNKQTVYYNTQEEKEQLLINLEGSGSFYNHYPHKRLDKYLSSFRHSYLKDKYDYILHFDIENYFGSIYTHSYTWVIAKNNLDAKKLNRTNSLFAKADQLLQNLNGSKTNGIIIGPELSRTLAEFLIIFIDNKVINSLYKNNIVRGKDYEIARFVDDFYLYTNEKNISERIYNVYKDILNEFHLKLNEAKTELINSDEDVKRWYNPTRQFTKFILEEVINIKENIDDSNVDDIIQSKEYEKKNKQITYSSLKSMIDQIILNYGEARTVSSYVLSTILSILEKNNEVRDKVKINNLNFINFIFYLVSIYPSYIAIQKLVSILDILLKDENFEKEYIERAISRYSRKIFGGYINDWMNLIIFCGVNDIRLTKHIEEKYIFGYFNDSSIDPRILAGITIYLKSTSSNVNRKKVFNKINILILKNIARINLNENNFKEIFMNKYIWWIIIFISCPYKELHNSVGECNNILTKAVKLLKRNERDFTDQLKILVLEFLLNNDNYVEKNGFIRWDIYSKNSFDSFYFFTTRRTIFNPGDEDFITLSY